MSPHDSPRSTEEPAATNEPARRDAIARAATDSASSVHLTRRGALRTTAGLGVAALGLGAASASGAAHTAPPANIQEFQTLTVDEDNRIVNEDGEPFVLRGLAIPDPKRVHRTRYLRGKTPLQLLDRVTSTVDGWHPRVIRVPASPVDIGEHPMGHLGPEYEDGELESPDVVADDRRKQRPPQPPAFTREELLEYLEEYYDPVVERCEERGVYCIVDYHRHWHEQPPGKEDPSAAENHLPYDSPYTNYWAYNTYEDSDMSFGEEAPASWGHVDQAHIEEWYSTSWGFKAPPEDVSDLEGTPLAAEHWQVNEALLEEALLFWDVVAQRYGDMDHVVFEAYDEPTAPAIRGPVDGCAALKQQPLWDTYLDEFMGPILDQIREHQEEQVVLASVPGRCRSLQGLHWRSFADAGYENVAVTWHNYGNDDVSQVQNWLNDTDYQSPEDVAEETGGELENPFLAPPSSVSDPDCWGWEGYESQGLQNAMDYHPIVVTEFGWIDDPDARRRVRGSTTGQGTTNTYGIPFFDAMESDDRISWVASSADVRREPTMFEFPDASDEGAVQDALVNDNFYDTPFEELPQPCSRPPCEWKILDGEDSGKYVKHVLATHAEDSVPFDLEPETEPTCPDSEGNAAEVDGRTVCDVNGDGYYRDVTGDESVGQTDVVEFFEVQHRDAWKRPELFDFSGSGEVGHGDVVELFEHVATRP